MLQIAQASPERPAAAVAIAALAPQKQPTNLSTNVDVVVVIVGAVFGSVVRAKLGCVFAGRRSGWSALAPTNEVVADAQRVCDEQEPNGRSINGVDDDDDVDSQED